MRRGGSASVAPRCSSGAVGDGKRPSDATLLTSSASRSSTRATAPRTPPTWRDYQGVTVDDSGEDVAAVFWRADRFEELGHDAFFLGGDPAARVPDWGADNPLDATWVHLRRREDGHEPLHLNTHFDDESERSRVERAQLVIARLDRLQAERGDAPVVVTGDFNRNPWSPAYRAFIAAGFVDTFRAAGHGDSAASSTFPGVQGADYVALE